MPLPFIVGAIAKVALAPIMQIVGKHLDAKVNRDTLQAEIEKALIASVTEVAGHQADIIMAEAQGESWLQRNWRPVSALCFLWVAMWFAWLQPATVAWFGWTPLRIGDPLLLEVIGLLKICLGGYIGGRSVEKVASTLAGRK